MEASPNDALEVKLNSSYMYPACLQFSFDYKQPSCVKAKLNHWNQAKPLANSLKFMSNMLSEELRLRVHGEA